MIKYVIDIGSNSCRLMKADFDGKNVRTIYKKLITARTGAGVNASRILNADAIKRTRDAIIELNAIAKSEDENARPLCFATSAVRDALNKNELISAIKADTGIDVDVISGQTEGDIGFLGAVGHGTGGFIDIGGCSTEIAQGKEEIKTFVKSFDIGAVRAKDMFADDVFKTQDYAENLFKDLPRFSKEVFAVGGTCTTLAAMLLNLEKYDPALIHGYVITQSAAKELLEKILPLTTEQRAELNGLEPKRADIICHGAAILLAFFKASGAERITVSESDNLEGYLLNKMTENR